MPLKPYTIITFQKKESGMICKNLQNHSWNLNFSKSNLKTNMIKQSNTVLVFICFRLLCAILSLSVPTLLIDIERDVK